MSNQVKRTRPKARDPPVSFVWTYPPNEPKRRIKMNKEYNLSSIKRCFIIDGNEYREVPADHVLDHGEYKEDFKNRYFYPFKDILLEMSREDRRYFYACAESMENMIKQPKKQVKHEKKFVIVSIEALLEETGDGNQHLDFLEDHNSNVTEQAEPKRTEAPH